MGTTYCSAGLKPNFSLTCLMSSTDNLSGKKRKVSDPNRIHDLIDYKQLDSGLANQSKFLYGTFIIVVFCYISFFYCPIAGFFLMRNYIFTRQRSTVALFFTLQKRTITYNRSFHILVNKNSETNCTFSFRDATAVNKVDSSIKMKV